eukprot:385592_1
MMWSQIWQKRQQKKLNSNKLTNGEDNSTCSLNGDDDDDDDEYGPRYGQQQYGAGIGDGAIKTMTYATVPTKGAIGVGNGVYFLTYTDMAWESNISILNYT